MSPACRFERAFAGCNWLCKRAVLVYLRLMERLLFGSGAEVGVIRDGLANQSFGFFSFVQISLSKPASHFSSEEVRRTKTRLACGSDAVLRPDSGHGVPKMWLSVRRKGYNGNWNRLGAINTCFLLVVRL